MLHSSGLLFVLVFMLLVWWLVGWTSCFPLEWRLAYCRCAGASVLGVCVRHARVRFCGTVLSRVGSYSLVWRWPVLDCILVTSTTIRSKKNKGKSQSSKC
jgi:hypothetical protein